MHKRTEKICGKSDIIPNFDEIGNDPNFVFLNDPNFEPVSLFNAEGNSVMVNSWLECANYVNVGWTDYYSDFFNGEKYYFTVLSISFLFYFVSKKYNFFKSI